MKKKYLSKIIATDNEGLQIISACCENAKIKASEIKYLKNNKIFLLLMERFKNETNQNTQKIYSICKFEFVENVRSKNINQKDKGLMLELLAIKIKESISAKYITVTKGKLGAFLMDDNKIAIKCPGFAEKVVDKVGSGDALLAILSICLFSKLDEELSLFIASIAAAQSVETIGNSKPVDKLKLLKTISHSLK